MAWTDVDLTNIKTRKIHIDEIVSQLNYERSRRGYGSITIAITALQTKILVDHVTAIRNAIDALPLSSGCSSYYSTVYSSNNAAIYSSNKSSVDSSYRSSVKSSNYRYKSSYYGGHLSSNMSWYYSFWNGRAKDNFVLGSHNCNKLCASHTP